MLFVTAFVCASTCLCFTEEVSRPSPPILVMEGAAAETKGDPEKAGLAYAAAVAGSPALAAEEFQGAVLGWARSALEMKDGAGALAALARLPASAAAALEAQVLSARARFLEGRLREAEVDFARLAGLHASAEAEYFLGVILFDRGKRLDALTRFESTLRLDPTNYYAQVYRARSLLELDRAQAALPFLEELVASYRTPEALYLLGKALLRLDRAADAVVAFHQALAIHPGYTEALFSLGAAQRQAGDAVVSRQTLERFALLHRQELELLQKLDALSQESLRRPGDASLAEGIARASLDGGDLDGAERHAWRALRLEPQRSGARLVLARAFVRSGRYSAAALHLQRTLEFDPEHAEARQELASLVAKHARPRGE